MLLFSLFVEHKQIYCRKHFSSHKRKSGILFSLKTGKPSMIHNSISEVCIIGSIKGEIAMGPLKKTPGWGEKSFVKKLEFRKSGSLLNTAFPLARLGVKSLPMGIVGNDELGYWLLDEIRNYGLQIEAIETVYDTSTACHVSLSNLSNDYIGFDYPGTSNHLNAELLLMKNGHYFEESRLIILSDIFSLPGLGIEGAGEIFQYAFNNNKQIFFDCGSNPREWTNETKETILDMLKTVTYFSVSRTEGKSLTGADDPREMAYIFRNYGPEAVIIKCGENGSFASIRNQLFDVPAFPVTIERNAPAGDIFNAGIIYGLLNEWGHQRVLTFANAMAAIFLAGEFPSYPTRIEVERFIDSFEE